MPQLTLSTLRRLEGAGERGNLLWAEEEEDVYLRPPTGNEAGPSLKNLVEKAVGRRPVVLAISTVISSSVIKTPSCSNLLLPSITVSLLSSSCLSDGFMVANGEACSSLGVS